MPAAKFYEIKLPARHALKVLQPTSNPGRPQILSLVINCSEILGFIQGWMEAQFALTRPTGTLSHKREREFATT